MMNRTLSNAAVAFAALSFGAGCGEHKQLPETPAVKPETGAARPLEEPPAPLPVAIKEPYNLEERHAIANVDYDIRLALARVLTDEKRRFISVGDNSPTMEADHEVLVRKLRDVFLLPENTVLDVQVNHTGMRIVNVWNDKGQCLSQFEFDDQARRFLEFDLLTINYSVSPVLLKEAGSKRVPDSRMPFLITRDRSEFETDGRAP